MKVYSLSDTYFICLAESSDSCLHSRYGNFFYVLLFLSKCICDFCQLNMFIIGRVFLVNFSASVHIKLLQVVILILSEEASLHMLLWAFCINI